MTKALQTQLSAALEIASATDAGRVRKRNEDFVCERPSAGLVVLADGMGGYNAGDVASGMAADLIAGGIEAEWLNTRLSALPVVASKRAAVEVIARHVMNANAAVFNAAKATREYAGMGTTAVIGLFFDNCVAVAHVGDSRMYRLRGEELTQITRDHSLLQEQIDQGLISKEEARSSQNKNLVTRAIGVDATVEVETTIHNVEVDDLYLFCSDGLNDMVDDGEICLTLQTLRANPRLAVEHLVQTANDNGGRDNISVVLVKINDDFAVSRGWMARLQSWFNA